MQNAEVCQMTATFCRFMMVGLFPWSLVTILTKVSSVHPPDFSFMILLCKAGCSITIPCLVICMRPVHPLWCWCAQCLRWQHGHANLTTHSCVIPTLKSAFEHENMGTFWQKLHSTMIHHQCSIACTDHAVHQVHLLFYCPRCLRYCSEAAQPRKYM